MSSTRSPLGRELSVPSMVFPSMSMNVHPIGATFADLRDSFDKPRAKNVTSPVKRHSSFDGSHRHWIGNLSGHPMRGLAPQDNTRVLGSIPRPHAGKIESNTSHTQRLSSSEDTEATAYYTAMSLDDQIKSCFERYRRPDHPDLVGRPVVRYCGREPLGGGSSWQGWDSATSHYAVATTGRGM
jgi:hypothetical protein